MALEKPLTPLPSAREAWHDFGLTYGVNGAIAFIFATSGPVAIILTIGSRGGLDASQLSSWVFGAFLVNSLLSIAFSLLYRQPLVFFWTIPGTVLVGAALTHLSFPQVVGAFFATGVLMIVLGLTGWVRRVMDLIPMPIVMAMVAGVFLQFGLDLMFALRDGLTIAAPMCLVFALLSVVPALGRMMPPLIGALIVGVFAIALEAGSVSLAEVTAITVTVPTFVAPEFSLAAMVELVIPLTITVIVVQNGQGFAVLKAAGHEAPKNAVAVACGAFSIATAGLGTVSTCLTGPVNALVSASGEPRRHYTGAIFVAVLGLIFGLFASVFTDLLLAAPAAFIATLAGLAMLRVLQGAMTTAFGGACSFGALITFLVTLADIPIFSLAAPFWGLLFGCATTWALERADYRAALAGPDSQRKP
jgi:benzoate membrane transport protein